MRCSPRCSIRVIFIGVVVVGGLKGIRLCKYISKRNSLHYPYFKVIKLVVGLLRFPKNKNKPFLENMQTIHVLTILIDQCALCAPSHQIPGIYYANPLLNRIPPSPETTLLSYHPLTSGCSNSHNLSWLIACTAAISMFLARSFPNYSLTVRGWLLSSIHSTNYILRKSTKLRSCFQFQGKRSSILLICRVGSLSSISAK